MLRFNMGSEVSQAEAGGTSCRRRRGVLFKLAILAGVLAPVLVFLFAPRRDPFGLSVGPAAPLGKVAPQLIYTYMGVSMLLAPDGSIWCWGSANSPYTRMVQGLSETPQRVGMDTDWCRVAAGSRNGHALKRDGSLWGWGQTSGRVAAHSEVAYAAPGPTRIGTDTDWTQIAAGAGHCLALKRDGSLWAWGQNDHGQVGDGTTSRRLAPARIGTNYDWTSIAAGDFNSFALNQDGTLWGWGLAMATASGGDDLSPRQVDSIGNIVAISANDYFLLALRVDGTLWICGANASSAASAYVGDYASTLVQIGKAADWKEVYAGRRFFLARKRNGTWWVCGQFKRPPPLWSSPRLASPRRLPLRFEPWALAPGLGDALLLTRDGALWNLSVGPDVSKFALKLARLKALLNRTFANLPGHWQPFDLKEFRVVPTVRKLWELPPEVRPQDAIQQGHQP
jgi:alpha-tubulin suppressor-like RCC1 family protein